MELISKYKVIDNIKSIICRGGDAQDILKMVNQMRPIEQKMGHWKKQWRGCGMYEYICSECDCGEDIEFDYCPNCGAKMCRGEE